MVTYEGHQGQYQYMYMDGIRTYVYEPESDDDIDPMSMPEELWRPRHHALFGRPFVDDPDAMPPTEAQSEQTPAPSSNACSGIADTEPFVPASTNGSASADGTCPQLEDKRELLSTVEVPDLCEWDELTAEEFDILERCAQNGEYVDGVGVHCVVIRGLTAQETLSLCSLPAPHPCDHAASHPSDDEHHRVSWISCIYLDCPIHTAQKQQLNVYPAREADKPLTCVFAEQESFMFDRVVARENGYVILQRC